MIARLLVIVALTFLTSCVTQNRNSITGTWIREDKEFTLYANGDCEIPITEGTVKGKWKESENGLLEIWSPEIGDSLIMKEYIKLDGDSLHILKPNGKELAYKRKI